MPRTEWKLPAFILARGIFIYPIFNKICGINIFAPLSYNLNLFQVK